MSEKLIKPYEISVWEDKLIQDGNEYKLIENKLAVIGSDTMTGLNRVYDPVFDKKSNGEKTLDFSLKYKYLDPYSENEEVINPFVALLTNERKVKLHYGNKWYEFIVKDHNESSEGYEWTYSCDDAFVLELSKNGYNLTFDSELNNNQGTATELAGATLKDTDWKLGESDSLKQLIAEPVYKARLVSTEGIEIINASRTDEAPPSAETDIYLFYSYVKNQDGKYVQFIIRDENRKYVIDDKRVITDTNFRIVTDLVFKEDHFENENGTTIIVIEEIETKYQVNRLAYGQLTTYDPVMERTVDRFSIGSPSKGEIYRYTDYSYTTSNVVMNYFVNGENFNSLEDGSLQGWNPYVEFEEGEGKDVKKLELVTKPEIGEGKTLVDIVALSQIEGFLKAYFPGALNAKYQNTIYNSGIENNASFVKSISVKEKFVFRWRAGKGEIDSLTPATDLRMLVAKYEQDTPTFGRYYKHIDPNNIILNFNVGQPKELNNYITGGALEVNQEGKYNYVIDDVVQTPSVKYIYVNNTDNKEYVWNGLNGTFEEKTENNYLPYYYLVAEASKGLSNTILSDVTAKIGIFIYNTTGEETIYIEDIQLLRFVPDASDPTGEKPILMGNVPTAVSRATDYYYLKPADGTAAEDVVTYVNLEELASQEGIEDEIVPLYNENSEKNLSISASKTNCFDILQTIAETFECWVDLVVLHDENGYITYDEDGNPEKYVYLREYAGKDNWAGFKYGINLQSIERNINSSEFVTKLIVEQSQSDYVDEGFVSIASAPSNISGESYILNFDYYYSQNLLNREETEADRLNFIEKLTKLNLELQEKEKLRRDLELSLTELGSKRNIYTELIESARTEKTDSLGYFKELTNREYSEYQQLQVAPTTIKYNSSYYIPTEDTKPVKDKPYFTYEEGIITKVSNVSENPQSLGYYESLPDYSKEETIIDLVGKIYMASSIINSYSGLLTNIEEEYWKVRKQLRGLETYNVKVWTGEDELSQRHVFVELNDYLPGFSFEIDGSTYQSTVSTKFFDIETRSNLINFTAPSNYSIEQSSYTIIDGQNKTFTITPDEEKKGIASEVDKLLEEKTKLVKSFNNKYSRFIQEGTWSSTDYIDSEKYYLDALQVSNTSAQPVVSYTINVVEISELEGFEWYLFDAGEKTYIEDTEFFGWTTVNGVLTPAREEVIVSEVEWHLEEPAQNKIVVQNYKTRFEDLFQRISATVQTVQYNEATYAKTSSLLDSNGTINQNVLLDSLNNISGKEYALTSNGSIIVKDDVILVQNLTNPANHVIINSEGIRVSADGGENYTTVIDGQGMNIGAVYTGTLNTNEVVIGNRQNPSFRWDKAGISAFKLNEANPNTPYDLQTFVRFDQYGLYGIKNNENFKANNLQEILDNAHFAVTWDGFFIKNTYPGGGRVEITSDNDFRVMNIPEGKIAEQEKIKIGALEWGKDGQGNPILSPDAAGATYEPTLYGIRIKNNDGDTVMKTGDDGNLEITGTINAGGGNFYGVVTVGKDETDSSKPYIEIDGLNSLIKSSNYQDDAGYGWMINKDGDAVFNNITARGAIKTAVFEYAEIQAVGGIFIFRPSSTIRTARISGNDLVVTVEKPMLFKDGQWCKVSNYTNSGEADDPDVTNILLSNGLTHVYRVSRTQGSNNITLVGAAAMVSGQGAVTTLDKLIGGALVDMGNKANGDGEVGTSNYGIGINSSDNTVNLPARAISLFETVVDETHEPKVTYKYRGILGTLPTLPTTDVSNTIYNQQMAGTQGIYTDNMYIGDNNQFIAFYEDENGDKQLRIRANQIIYEVTDDQGQGTGVYHDINQIEAEGVPGEDAVQVIIDSSAGNMFLRKNINTTLVCSVYKGTTNITNQVTRFTWTKKDKDGNIDSSWVQPQGTTDRIVIGPADVASKAIFTCEVEF